MAHFNTLVLMPKDLAKKGLFKNPDDKVTECMHDLLYAYAAYFPDEPYKIPCSCLGHKSQRAGIDAADQRVGEFWQLYRTYLEEPKEERPSWSEYEPVQAWQQAASAAARAHSEASEPDPNCEYCTGSGIQEFQENVSRVGFDYFNVDGMMDVEVDSEFVVNVDDLDLQDPLEFEAIVTPDGRWHSVEWGVVHEDPAGEWEKKSKEILQAHHDCIAIKCNMHI